MDSRDMRARTKMFGLRVIRVVRALPKTIEGRELGKQLVRSGTSVGANYRSACRGRSRAEFIAKLGISLEEADETGYWLELIIESGMMKVEKLAPLLQEANELTAILNTAKHSARSRQRSATSNIKNHTSHITLKD